MNGIESIAAERQRQIEVEGWTREHDDAHADGEMAKAAACYAWAASLDQIVRDVASVPSGGWEATVIMRRLWPWASEWWKPKDSRSDLVRAGALIAAEIDRLDRAENARINAEGWQDAPGRVPDCD